MVESHALPHVRQRASLRRHLRTSRKAVGTTILKDSAGCTYGVTVEIACMHYFSSAARCCRVAALAAPHQVKTMHCTLRMTMRGVHMLVVSPSKSVHRRQLDTLIFMSMLDSADPTSFVIYSTGVQ